MKNRLKKIHAKYLHEQMADISKVLWDTLNAWLNERGHDPNSLPPPFVTMAVLNLCLGVAAASTNPPGDKLATAEDVKKMIDLVDVEDPKELFIYLCSLTGGVCEVPTEKGKE